MCSVHPPPSPALCCQKYQPLYQGVQLPVSTSRPHRYDSSFSSLEDSLAQGYSGVSKVTEDGKEKVLMRVVVVGGGEEEGQFVKNLSEKGAGTLVDGLYVLWDPT